MTTSKNSISNRPEDEPVETEAEKKTRRRLANRESARRMRMRRVQTVIVLRQQVSSLTQQNLKVMAANVKLAEQMNVLTAALQSAKKENADLQMQVQRAYEVACGPGGTASTSLPTSFAIPPLGLCTDGMPPGLHGSPALYEQHASSTQVCPPLSMQPPSLNLSSLSSSSPLCSGMLSTTEASSFLEDNAALDKVDMGVLSPAVGDDGFMSFATQSMLQHTRPDAGLSVPGGMMAPSPF